MFTPSTWFLISKNIVDLWKGLEAATNEAQTLQYTKYADKGLTTWYKEQIKAIPNFEKAISNIANKQLIKINDESIEAIKKAIDLVDNEVLKSAQELYDLKGDASGDKEQFIASAIERITNFNEGNIKAFVKSASVRNGEFISRINALTQNKIKTEYHLKNQTQTLYDTIREQMLGDGIAKGVPFIYSDGRRMPFKSHMEMAIRTTIQNEAIERMERAGSSLGIIFYLASEHADSADDHAPYQGKVYVLENWESKVADEELREKIRKFIVKNNIRTLEWVKGAPVWFNTRPNCRHYFVPITIEQAMGDINQLKKELKTKKGTYREDNYKDLKQQRYYERQIRFYKERARMNQILMERTDDPIEKARLKQEMLKDQYLVRAWQKRQRDLMVSNPYLQREYRREDVNKMAQDLGVKLHLRKEKPREYTIFEKQLKHQMYIRNLDYFEKQIIKSYTNKYYQKYNNVFAKPHLKSNYKYIDDAQKLSEILKQAKLDQDTIVYRGMNQIPEGLFKNVKSSVIGKINASFDERYSNVLYNEKEFKEIEDLFKNKLQEPQIYIQKGFMSTSYEKEAAEKFGKIQLILEADKELNGLNIESVSRYRSEKEILFDYGYKIEIKSYEIISSDVKFEGEKRKKIEKIIFKGRITHEKKR